MAKRPTSVSPMITHPIGDEPIQVGYPGACFGGVRCTGQLTPRDPAIWQLGRLCLRVCPSTVTMDRDYVLAGYEVPIWDSSSPEWNATNLSWDVPRLDNAQCTDQQCGNISNKVGAVAVWNKIGTFETDYDEKLDQYFNGYCPRTDVPTVTGKSSSTKKPKKPTPVKKPKIARVPVGKWLRYKDVEATSAQHGYGFRLDIPGTTTPLRASRIQIYVTDVSWVPHGIAVESSYRPLGTLRNALAPYRLPGASQNSLLVVQSGNTDNPKVLNHVVAASRRNDTDQFDVYNDQDLFVRLNDFPLPIAHSGTFTIWVKVLKS